MNPVQFRRALGIEPLQDDSPSEARRYSSIRRVGRWRMLTMGALFILSIVSFILHTLGLERIGRAGLLTCVVVSAGFLFAASLTLLRQWALRREASDLLGDLPDSAGTTPFESGAYPPAL